MILIEKKLRSGRLSIVKDETLFEMIEQQPVTSTHTLSAELRPSQNTIS